MFLAITPFEKSEAALLRSTESVDESVRGHSWTEVYLTPAGLYVVGTCSRGHNGYYSVVPSYRAKQILAAADSDVFAEDEGLEVMFPAPGAPVGVEVKVHEEYLRGDRQVRGFVCQLPPFFALR